MASLRRRITVGIRNIAKIYGPYIQYEKFKSDPEHWNSSAPKIVYLPPEKFPAPAGPGSERLSIGRGRTSRYIFYDNGRKVVRAKSFEFWSSNRPFHHLFSPHAHGDIISHNSQWRDATLSLLAFTITAQGTTNTGDRPYTINTNRESKVSRRRPSGHGRASAVPGSVCFWGILGTGGAGAERCREGQPTDIHRQQMRTNGFSKSIDCPT